jgi:hypothetical protein
MHKCLDSPSCMPAEEYKGTEHVSSWHRSHLIRMIILDDRIETYAYVLHRQEDVQRLKVVQNTVHNLNRYSGKRWLHRLNTVDLSRDCAMYFSPSGQESDYFCFAIGLRVTHARTNARWRHFTRATSISCQQRSPKDRDAHSEDGKKSVETRAYNRYHQSGFAYPLSTKERK